MSLEQQIADLTAATKAHTAATIELLAITKDLRDIRAEAIETVRSAATTGGKAGTTKAETKPAATKAADTKPNISASPENRIDPLVTIKDSVAAYLTGTDRPEEREARKLKVKALLNHPKVKRPDVADATSVEHIMDDAQALFIDQIGKLVAKGDITEPAAEEALV
jgi:hypothetical protein